ncbi:MAG: N-acetylmuramoyl-L-alanine amidase family protein, partial [Oribacterium parvum]|nr:N-acetylmuramoyl-L-alanine amidase family protein [Oribacterium parvum]
WYYFSANGKMVRGWLREKSHYYYLDDGKILVNTTVTLDGRSFSFNEHGVCTSDTSNLNFTEAGSSSSPAQSNPANTQGPGSAGPGGSSSGNPGTANPNGSSNPGSPNPNGNSNPVIDGPSAQGPSGNSTANGGSIQAGSTNGPQ